MKILLAHNFYQQPGGEDQVFAAEAALLESRGHAVVRHTRHNDDVSGMGTARLAAATVWNGESVRALRALIRRERPAVAHFHNTLPLISPAALHAAKREGVATVQTLHNYRLVCPGALLLRDGAVCERCLGRAVAWPAVVHACYRGSRGASAAVAGMNAVHRALGTWSRKVDRYIALTPFAKSVFVKGGLPAARIAVKPNFVAAGAAPPPDAAREGFALFVGRLSPEKGVATLLEAWRRLPAPPRLLVAGDGPLRGMASRAAAENPAVEILGQRPADEIAALMRRAAFLVFPSIWYEGMPRTLIEAFAAGTPVVASDLGAMRAMLAGTGAGRLFAPGDAAALAAKVEQLLSHPAELSAMRAAARAEYEAHYTPEANYDMLMRIYEDAIAAARGG